MEPLILSIDTSCDETSAALSAGRRVLSNVVSSQINIHKKYGGVFPALAKRAHEEKIDYVVGEAIKRAHLVFYQNHVSSSSKGPKSEARNPKHETNSNDKNSNFQNVSNFDIRISDLPLKAVAVTYGPGLAIALEVGIRKARELSTDYGLPLIAINHMEGHIYSCLAQNANGKPKREIQFPASPSTREARQGGPALCLLVSGGHTELVLMENHGKYKVLGSTLDDACGEALDKAAKILKLGYPGGPIIERLAESFYKASPCESARRRLMKLSPPLKEKNDLNFSYSGLKTQFLYLVNSLSEKEFNENLRDLALCFQTAAFEQLIRKTANAIRLYSPKTLICGGGVIANKNLRSLIRKLAKERKLPVYFPSGKKLIGDNAAMIGVAAYYKYLRKEFVQNINSLDREPRLSL